MIGLNEVAPDSVLIGAEHYNLYALTYLLQLTDQDITKEQKSELIWILTRQLLIAESLFKKGIVVKPHILKEKLEQIKKNEVIIKLIESSIVQESILLEIIEIEHLYTQWCIELEKDFKEQYLGSQEELENFYENSDLFTQKNVYEIYQFATTISLGDSFNSLAELKKALPKETALTRIGFMDEKDIKSKLKIEKKDISLQEVISHRGSFYYIAQFMEEYKSPYEEIKNELILFIVEQELENNIEEYAQQLLDHTQINYNEDVLKNLI